ncbi:MAG TPA: TOBE domain-containing protein, partial [Casimicrobiaceae bacterium]|nr:TOBE domain-containing protein [Casimicrobiaceae bacterium]
RPHRLRLVKAGEGALPGICKRTAYLGSRIEYMVATPWGELLVFDGTVHTPRGRDEPVGVTFDPDDAIVLRR